MRYVSGGKAYKKDLMCQVLIDMIRIPDWAFEVVGQEMRGMGQDAGTYHPGLNLTAAEVSVISHILLVLRIISSQIVNDVYF